MPSDNELHKAAHKGDLEACQKLIESPEEGEDPIDVNEAGASDRRALQRAAGAGHLAVCEYLISKGAQVDLLDKSGRTALHWAAIGGSPEIIQLLITHGANILAETANKANALHLASEAGRADIVKALMEACGQDVEKKTALTSAKNSDDNTPWKIALDAKNQPVCQMLKDMGDPNAASSACVIC